MEDKNAGSAGSPVPEQPGSPENAPQASKTPSAPPAPEAPQAPAAPPQPAAPETPAAPQTPQQPAAPQSPAQPAAPAQPVGFDPTQPFGGQRPAQPGQPMQPQQPPQPQQPGTQQPPQPTQPIGFNSQGAYPPPPTPPVYAQKSSGKAIGALVCGILAILFSALPLLGIILGIVAIVLASKAAKQIGRDGKATAGKVCGIVGIVFSVLAFIFWGMISCAAIAAYNDAGNVSYSYNQDDGSVSGSFEVLGADEQAAQDAAVAELDKLASQDDATVQYLATELDEGFTEQLGMSHTELGIDPADLARWLLTDFSYTPDGVYVDEATGTATMYADVEMRDSYAFMLNFYGKVEELESSEEIKGMSVDEAKARIGELYYEAMDETSDMTTYYTAIDLVNKDGQWVVDQDEWEDELDSMFVIY